MRWNDNELKLVIGYYLTEGNKQSGSTFLKLVNKFNEYQNRGLKTTRNTVALKLMNIDSLRRELGKNEGGLRKSKQYNRLILEYTEDELESFYKSEMIDAVPADVSYSKKQTLNPDELDIDYKYKDHREAKISYTSISLEDYISHVKTGIYKVPLFQRKFAWSKQDIISFLNSLFRGFPFGSITVWKGGKNALPDRNKFIQKFQGRIVSAQDPSWLIDGQQRTTSIISQLVDVSSVRKNKGIVFDLNTNKFVSDSTPTVNYVEARDLIKGKDAFDLVKKYNIEANVAAEISKVSKALMDTKIGIILIEDATIDSAISIFSEMNTAGKRLSFYDIVHAKWLSSEINKDLEKYILDWQNKKDYKPDETTIVRAMYLAFSKENISSKNILSYSVTQTEIDLLDNIKKAMDEAVDFLLHQMKFKPELMPSKNLFRFLTYFFFNVEGGINQEQMSNLKSYIKYVCMEDMYSSSTDQKLKKNIEVMDDILSGSFEKISKVTVDEDKILGLEYNDNSSSYLYVINRLFNVSKSLENNSDIPPASASVGNSKINIHHIIPKANEYSNKKVKDMKYGNSIANLTPILEKDNNFISDKLPKEYYEYYKSINSQIDITLDNMFISPEHLSVIKEDTRIDIVELFIVRRAERIAKFINAD